MRVAGRAADIQLLRQSILWLVFAQWHGGLSHSRERILRIWSRFTCERLLMCIGIIEVPIDSSMAGCALLS
jgi:hypothetical protein